MQNIDNKNNFNTNYMTQNNMNPTSKNNNYINKLK